MNGVMPTQAMKFEPAAGALSLSGVRTFLRHACSGALSPERVGDAELLGTELVVNALRHGTAPVSIQVDRLGDTIRIAVCDQGSGRPRQRAADGTDESGRGLVLLRALSKQWGVIELDPGKAVWFTLADSI